MNNNGLLSFLGATMSTFLCQATDQLLSTSCVLFSLPSYNCFPVSLWCGVGETDLSNTMNLIDWNDCFLSNASYKFGE